MKEQDSNEANNNHSEPESSEQSEAKPQEDSLEEEADELLEEIEEADSPDEKREKIIQASARFSGPLPPPSLLQQYDEVTPGLAERIITMAENEV